MHSPKLVTLSGITTLVALVHPAKAFDAIAFTGNPLYLRGTIISLTSLEAIPTTV